MLCIDRHPISKKEKDIIDLIDFILLIFFGIEIFFTVITNLLYYLIFIILIRLK